MARRKSKTDSVLIGSALLVGIPAFILIKLTDTIGIQALIVTMLGLVAVVAVYFVRKRAKRLAYLRAKYRDEVVVRNIMDRRFWPGQTAAQLYDSLGRPASVDNNLLKTRKREIWKYHPSGVNRYRLRITLDNDVVVSWDQKN